MHRTIALSALLIAAIVVGGCSSGSSSIAASPSTAAPPTTACTSASGPPAAPASAPPAVANATDLKVAPVAGAGTGSPPTQLVIIDLVVGTGKEPTTCDTVSVQYAGSNYADGKVFDSSWTRGQPTSFPLSGVVPGFEQGILGMKVGGRREVVIPPALGYGTQGSPPAVGPDETLVFLIDLVGVQ
jgi:peptidylprolyl isomerase